MTARTKLRAATRNACPDGGSCHHACLTSDGEHGVPCFRVGCCVPLSGVFPQDRWPDTVREEHGERPNTPDTLNLTAAAEWLLVIRADPTVNSGPAWTAALALWEQLTGLHDDAAVRYALTVRDTPTRAAVLPF